MIKIKIWIRDRYRQIINSIAFFPAIIAIAFLLISYFSISFDFSKYGKQFKSQLHWLKLRDASTARSIISAITAGLISLTVFSFSMVMIVLNQTASQMSNRILDNLIGSRFQQIVLGIYMGTIVYALFLLSSVRDVDSGLQIPALSTFLLILITILDIFLFIYFLHYITQSVKYKVIIRRIYKDTKLALASKCCLEEKPLPSPPLKNNFVIYSAASGIYEGFDKKSLQNICKGNDCSLLVLPVPGTFLLEGVPVANSDKQLSREAVNEINEALNQHAEETVEENYFYGFRQLAEVALKALSPGINDPGTAIECIRALFQLFTFRMRRFPENEIRDDKNKIRILVNELTCEEIFERTILPIWDYGKNDRMVRHEMHHLLTQFNSLYTIPAISELIKAINLKIDLQNS